ncbi:MAG: hypothetical protein JJU01_07365 [Alkalibacterium sp.]|nr:hypothetical protein [Alkalibacterium sp.]
MEELGEQIGSKLGFKKGRGLNSLELFAGLVLKLSISLLKKKKETVCGLSPLELSVA